MFFRFDFFLVQKYEKKNTNTISIQKYIFFFAKKTANKLMLICCTSLF